MARETQTAPAHQADLGAFQTWTQGEPHFERCAAAAFGMGRKTRYDRTVRDALQIKAEGGAFSVLHLDPNAAGILEQIRRELVPHAPGALTAELYNLNVYARGGSPIRSKPRQLRETGFACRCYPGGLPSEEMIRAAVRESRGQ